MHHLGEHAISKIMDDPEALNGVVNKQKAQEIYETIVEHQGLESNELFKWLRFWNETFY